LDKISEHNHVLATVHK